MPEWNSPDMHAFRAEVRIFLRAAFPDDLRTKIQRGQPLIQAEMTRWQKILQSRRYYVGHWPEEHGGLNWTALERIAFEDEMLSLGCPYLPPANPNYVGPLIMNFGSPQMQDRFLAPTRESDIIWCQGYSEPGAGSDLAGLKTRAVLRGDSYIVNGQKTWTSYAHVADWIFALVRTSTEERPQNGLTFLLVDLKSPGVEIRPIMTMDMTSHCNEVFFDNVEVPVENRVGEEGKAWGYSRLVLSNERLIVVLLGKYRRMLTDIRRLSSETFEGSAPLSDASSIKRQITECEILLQVLSAVLVKLLGKVESAGELGPMGSIPKLRSSELEQKLGQLMMDILARRGLPFQTEARAGDWEGERIGSDLVLGNVTDYLMRRAATIYGGSSEVMRNIIGHAAFGFCGI